MSENKQDITQLRQRLAQSTIVVDATRRFTSTLDFDEIRLALFEATFQIVGAQQIVLHFIDEQGWQSFICYPMEDLRIETAVLPSEATAYRIYRELEPVIWHHDDANQSALPISVEVIDKFGSYLALPLIGAKHVVGVIEALNLLEPQNAAQQVDLLMEIAGSAGLALYNGMVYREAQQSRQLAQEYLDMQNVLHEINIELFGIDDLDELYRTAVELAHTRLGFERVGLYLLNESNDLLLGAHGVDAEGNIRKEQGPEYVIDQKETIETFVLNRTRLVVDEDIDLWDGGEVVGRGWHIGAAMWSEDSPIGVIFADNLLTGQPLKSYQSELLFAYAGIVSNLIQRNRYDTIITERAAEMQAVAEVGTAAATILDTDKLLQEVVDLTKNRFDLYHAHIYLLDTITETLVLTSGSGTIGQQMVAEGRQIPLQQEQSLVARAARSRQGVVINDVQADPGFLPHPLLPDTRAEMAVPLITGEQVLGVLDVQSDRLNYFSKEDINTLTTLAAQMAVALQNARLFTESEERAEELALVNKVVAEVSASLDIEHSLQIVANELAKVVDLEGIGIALLNDDKTSLTVVAEHYSSEQAASILGYTYPIAGNPVTQKAFSTRNTVLVEDAQNHPLTEPIHAGLRMRGVQTMYVIPMFAGNEIVGTVGFDSKEKDLLMSPQQLRLAETIVYQVATAVQTARQYDAIQRSQESLRQSEAELSEALKIAKLAYWEYDVEKDLFTFNDQFYALFHTTAEEHGGYQLSSAYYAQNFVHPDDLALVGAEIERALNSTDRHYNRLLEHRILYADGGVGYITVNINIDRDEHGNILRYYGANQDITERKQAEEALAKQARELQIVAELSTTVATTLEQERLLQEVVDLTRERFDFYHAQIYVLNAQQDTLVLGFGAGDVGRKLVAQEHRITLNAPQSLVAQAARSGQAVVVNDVRENPNWLSNELLPETKAEMAVPMMVGDRVVGVLDVQSGSVNRFTDQDIQIQTTLAAQAAVALQNARLFTESEERAEELALVNKVVAEVSASLDIDQSLQIVADELAKVVDLEGIGIALLNDDKTSLTVVAEHYNSEQAASILGYTYPIAGNPVTQKAFSTRNTVLVEDAQNHPLTEPIHAGLRMRGVQTMYVIPMFAGNEIVGTVGFDSKEKDLLMSPQQLRLAETIVYQVATAVQTTRQYDAIKRSQESLRQSEAELSEALKIAKLAYWEYDVEKDLFTFNDQFFALFHTTAEEHGGYQLSSAYYGEHFVHPDDLPLVGTEIERALNSTDRHYSRSLEHRILYADGGVGYISVNINIDRDEQGNILHYYGANQDITERKLFEEAIQKEQERVQIILESINVPFAVTKASDGKVIYCNKALGDLVGVPRENLIGQGMPDFYANPSDREAYISRLREQGFVNNFDLQMKRADSQEYWALLSGRLIEFQGEPAIITFALDVTERREAQATIARRATELETVADVSAVAATILEPEELLQQVVDLTKERFDLYHAHIYLLDKDIGQLTLSNGAGEVGRTMVAEGRQIALNRKKSLVARAARDKKGVVINDVQAEPGFLSHPLLPETRAEMAVPLLARDEVLGVLDVQADSINRFREEDVNIFTTLAAQIAIALQNARFLNQSEKAVKELQELSRRLTREGWQEYFTQRKEWLAFSYDQQQEVPVFEAGPELTVFPEDAKLVTQPLQVQGASVGQLQLEISEEYGDDESELLTAVTERLSAHLENLRLAEVSEKDRAAAEKRSQEMAVINNIVTQISTSLDLQHSLQIVVDELVTAVNVDQARVALIQPDKKEMLVIAEHYDASRATSAVGMTIPLAGNELTQRVIESRQMVVVDDAQNNPQTAPVHDLFREQGIQTVVLLPLVVNDEVIGTLGMDVLDDRPIQEDGLKLAETIVFQTATAIQNARLFEQVQATLAETEMLYSYSSQLNTATSLDAVLDSAAAAGFQVGATEALLLVYDRNSSGNPEYGQIAATAPRDEERVGEILYLQEQPARHLWPASGQNTVFVGDVGADDRLSPEEKNVFAQQGVKALGIMYLNVGNLRLGQIIIYWDKVQTFTNADERLYGAIAQQASSVVYNRLLFNQTEEALSETAALYQASADLNTAQTFDEVLTALRQHTIFGQSAHSVTISFFERPWDEDDLPEEVHVLAGWGAAAADGQPNRFKVDAFPGFLELLSHEELQVHEDVATDERISKEARVTFVENFNTKAIVYAPLIVGSRRLGFITGYYPEPMSFTEEQLRRLNVLTRQAAVTIQSIRLYEQTQEALAQTEALYTGSERIVLASTEDEILQSLILSTELRRLDRASLYMFDHPVEDRIPRDVSVVATWVNEGIPASVQVGTRFEVARVPFLSTVNPDESFVINDIRNDPRVDEKTRQILEGYGMISFIMVPVVVGSQWLGMVSGQSSEPMNMNDVQMRQANSLVGQAAVVMQTTILFRQEQARARREHLLREIATKVRSSTDIDTIMQTAVTEIGRTLGRRSFIKLGNGQNGDAQAGDDQLSQTQTENGAT